MNVFPAAALRRAERLLASYSATAAAAAAEAEAAAAAEATVAKPGSFAAARAINVRHNRQAEWSAASALA
eukprot:COSAG03_NODE_7219_length_947_cov_1.817217_1_plen_69_part_01